MTDKYSGLPDIDIDSAEVFETSDVDSEVDINMRSVSEVTENNSEVEELDLDQAQSRKRFSNDVLVGDINVVDFLGSIAKPGLMKTGYLVARLDETLDQRLSRIARELEEIKILKSKETPSVQNDTSEDLVKLLESLVKDQQPKDEANLNQYHHRIQEVFEMTSAKLEHSQLDSVELERPRLVDTSQVLALEARLHAIERTLGPDSLQSPFESKPTIQSYIDELARKINIVHNPEYQVDSLKSKIVQLSKEVETLSANKRLVESHPTEVSLKADANPNHIYRKIEDLHAKLPHFDHLNSTIPLITARLKTLHTVHADIANTVKTVHDLDQILDDLKSDLQKWNNSIDTVNTNIDKHEVQFASNREHVTQVIKDLDEKVTKLSE